MCGIAGHLSFDRPPNDITAMLDTLAHRGPDDSGTYDDDQIRLGFRRLAIVDLSMAGHQPMTNEDGRVWIIFNGEIYNYRDLADELRAHGHVFRSQTDTEVVLHGYEQWGVECLRHFNGMFAFALWDARREQLFCARDRFGVKPFYYFWQRPEDGLGMVFASEIKALLGHPRGPKPAANEQLIYDFLAAGMLDHTDQTCFTGISQLLPAHYLLITRQEGVTRRYWDLPQEHEACPAQPTPAQRQRWAKDMCALLEDSVRLRLHADVPVGTCLSGGLDSSSIVCLANRLLFGGEEDLPWHQRGERQKTFSACYEDPRHDERPYIERVLAATGAEANYTFPGQQASVEAIIPRVVWHQDEPFGSTSILAQWHVMEAAAGRGMKVMLDGQGADELLGGYHGYFGAALADDLLDVRPAQLLRDLQLLRRYHGPGWQQIARSTMHTLVPPGSAPRRIARSVYKRDPARTNWLGADFAQDRQFTPTATAARGSHLQTLLYNQATRTSLPALLHYEDRNSMAFSIEARTPFLDYRIAEYVAGLPNAALIENGVTKRVLRDAMRGTLPEPVRTRLDKKGFSTPEDIWFRTSLRDWAREILHSSSLAARGYVNPTCMQDILERHIAGETNESVLIWRVLNVELWARQFIDGTIGKP